MPKESRIEPVHIAKAQWMKKQDPPKGVLEGHPYGTNVVVIRYSVDEIGEGPNLHVHPYDEIFHILEGSAEFTVGKNKFIANAGDLVIGPANIPHAYKNIGPGRLDSFDVHLNSEWIQYDLPREGENLSSKEFS
ncbi:cupin domain-containing protein [Ulvibacterium sp.]|uniref:cupin domain-containing protein n=1 Tax=Ulvibacterium sp. TaxID=2665914 RepID=UPI002612D0E5|nr:cupin domain-containing protein [Ulvibacterium sp.]